MSRERKNLANFTRESFRQFAQTSIVSHTEDHKYQEISIDRIKPNPDQPRKFFSIDKLKELAASIRQVGIIEPLVVDHEYNILAGERRYRAAKIAGKKNIPVIVHKDITPLQKELFGLIENIQREDLRTIEKADIVKKVKNSYHLSIRKISKEIGMPKSTVQILLSIYKFLQAEALTLLRKAETDIGIEKLALLKEIPQENHISAIKAFIEGYTITAVRKAFLEEKSHHQTTSEDKILKKLTSFKKSIMKMDFTIENQEVLPELDSLIKELKSIRKKILEDV